MKGTNWSECASDEQEVITVDKHFWLSLFSGGILFLLMACGGSTGNNTSPGTRAGATVMIATDHSMYKPTNDIHVTVTNMLQIPIYTFDTRASCSILGLQTLVKGTWVYSNAARCLLGRHAVLVKIDAGKTYSATISPGVSGSNQAVFPTGTYRLVLSYVTEASSSAHRTTIYAESLEVTG
jgi:hypothetical protein